MTGYGPPLAALAASLSSLLLCGCTAALPSVPTPTQDLSAPAQGRYLTLDLRRDGGIPVTVQGEPLRLLVLPHAHSMLALNADVADRLGLREVMFGLGSASLRDGDHHVSGRVVRTRYRLDGAEEEAAWAIVMEEDIHPDYDGAISFGAIPARVFRIRLADDGADAVGDWRTLTLTGRSEALEQSRDYGALEFSQVLALHQHPVSANRKAAFYLRQARRLSEPGPVEPFSRLFSNTRPHRAVRLDPPLAVAPSMITDLLVEVEPDGRLPGARDTTSEDDVVVITQDARRTANAPTLYLGRAFFSGCYEIEVDKSRLTETVQPVRVRCAAP